jgi:hypothetical protein
MLESKLVAEERREYLRVPAKGTLTFRTQSRAIHCRLISVSEAGIEATCELGFVEQEILGAMIDVDVRLDGAEGGWLTGHGVVTTVRPEHHRIVIALSDPIPEVSAYIAKSIIELHRPPDVMVVDRDRPRRTQTATAFRREECDVFEATTPLEALDHLDRGPSDPSLIEVAPTTPESVADELQDYLEVAHPDSEVVHVSGASSGVPKSQRDRSSERSALRKRVHAVLDRFRK